MPGTITARFTAGQKNWIGELRVVSVLFVNLPDLNYATTLDRAQDSIRYLQQELYRFEGSINKLNLDDKGISLLAALGLPPLAHEDDPRRVSVLLWQSDSVYLSLACVARSASPQGGSSAVPLAAAFAMNTR